jgi:biopolymer transport protein ExbD
MKTAGFLKHVELEQDFELNIASIIDCFVVLIAFILISTSFFSIGILDAEISGGGADSASAISAETIVVQLKVDRSIRVSRTNEGKNSAVRLLGTEKGWDFQALSKKIGEWKKTTPELDTAVIQADNAVSYRDVMAAMESAKTQLPKVSLGGF